MVERIILKKHGQTSRILIEENGKVVTEIPPYDRKGNQNIEYLESLKNPSLIKQTRKGLISFDVQGNQI